jgi:hypothetical protein
VHGDDVEALLLAGVQVQAYLVDPAGAVLVVLDLEPDKPGFLPGT